jgi:hypothetical protein
MKEPAAPVVFSAGKCIAAFLAALLIGGVLNIVAGFMALAAANVPLGALIGAVPGLLTLALSSRVKRDGFAQGLLAAGILVALVGGLCGFGLGHGLDMK